MCQKTLYLVHKQRRYKTARYIYVRNYPRLKTVTSRPEANEPGERKNLYGCSLNLSARLVDAFCPVRGTIFVITLKEEMEWTYCQSHLKMIQGPSGPISIICNKLIWHLFFIFEMVIGYIQWFIKKRRLFQSVINFYPLYLSFADFLCMNVTLYASCSYQVNLIFTKSCNYAIPSIPSR